MNKAIIIRRRRFGYAILLVAVIAVAAILVRKTIAPSDVAMTVPSYVDIEIGYTRLGKSLPIKEFGNRWILWPKALDAKMVPYYHTMIIARNTASGEEYYVSAGKSNCENSSTTPLFSSGSSGSGTRCCEDPDQLCVVAEALTEDSVDRLSEVVHRQPVGRIKTTFTQMKEYMQAEATRVNIAKGNNYSFSHKNCNFFASGFLKDLLGREIETHLPDDKTPFLVPGWNNSSGFPGLLDIKWRRPGKD